MKKHDYNISLIALSRFLCENDNFSDYVFCKLIYIL